MTTMIKHAIVTLVALGLLATGAIPATAVAQNEEPVPKYRIPGTSPEPKRFERNVPGLGERTFNILTSIHEDIGEQRFAEALERLRGLQERGRGSEYENALILQNMAFVYAMLERSADAVRAIEQALAIDALSHRETQNLFLMHAQLNAIEDRWDPALRVMHRYFYWEDKPTTDAIQLMALGYANKEDYRNTIVWAERLIESARTPREDYYVLLLWAHNELKQYDAAIGVLRQMIPLWPDKLMYWEQMAGLLMQLEREAESLAVYSVAYQRGLLKDESKILNLVRYYLFREAPFKAARILQTGLSVGNVESTRENWQLLSDAYNLAQETQDSIRALRRAAELAGDGELYIREAQLHASVGDWEGVESAVANAIDKGGLKRPGRAWEMRAMAAYERKNLQESLRMFRQAAQFDETRHRANQWTQYINNEIRVERALREGA